MKWALVILLFVLWFLGAFVISAVSTAAGWLIHLVLVAAVIVLLYDVILERRHA